MDFKKIILKIAFNLIFNYIDKNGDGQLSKAEIKDLEVQIKKLTSKIKSLKK